MINNLDKHKTVSLADQVFERLELDILTGNYEHGEILTETRLVSDLGVSRTPVREALNRLEAENLVRDTGKGLEVLGITLEDMKDIFEIRHSVEPMAAKRVAERITDEQLTELRDILDLQEFYLNKNNPGQIREADSSFHEKLYEFCDSPVLAEVLRPLHKKVQKYRLVSVSNHGHALLSVEEHRTILKALELHDGEAAAKAVYNHVIHAESRILDRE